MEKRHFRIDPVDSTRKLIAGAPLTPTPKGLQLAVELIAYRDGQMQLAVSRIAGPSGKRSITQADTLMFRDVDEVKDALDDLADRLAREAGQLPPSASGSAAPDSDGRPDA